MASATSSSSARPPASVRLRLALGLATLALCIILGQSLILLALFDANEERFIERQVSAQIEHSMAIWQKSPDDAFPNTPDMWLYRVPLGGGQTGEREAVPPAFAHLGVGNHEAYIGEREYHVAVRSDGEARYILAYDVGEHEASLQRLMLIVLACAIGFALLTLWAGYQLAGHLSRRLVRLAERVEQETPGPLVEPGMERELLALAGVLERYRERQQATLARERAFAGNLSHELRTPLTAIRTDAELLAALPGLPEAAVTRGNRIVGSVDRINALASSLLLLAREARPGPAETILLRPAIEAVWATLVLGRPRAPALQLEVHPDACMQADPSLVDLVLRNLLDNALRYTAAGAVHCVLVSGQLHVRDSGPGFSDEDLAHLFDRFHVGPRGVNGLGLALVRHVCTACGWQVSAGNARAGGGEVVVDFGGTVSADGIA